MENQTNDTSKKRSGLALRGTVAAATATAVLMGGFGAFALWQDSNTFGTGGTIQTGRLEILDVEAGQWRFAGNVNAGAYGPLNVNDVIDPNTFVASPGDQLVWDGTVEVFVQGSDLVAELEVQKLIDVHDDVDVAYTVTGANGAPIRIVGTPAGVTEDVAVEIRVDFLLTDFEQNVPDAVNLSDFSVTLQQVQS